MNHGLSTKPFKDSEGTAKSTILASPKGGSITPGSGDYSSRRAKPATAKKPSKHIKANTVSKDDGNRDDHNSHQEFGRWTNKLSWIEDGPEGPHSGHASDARGRAADRQSAGKTKVTPKTDQADQPVHEGLWVTLQPTSMSSSPFFDTLLVLVVSPLVTLTVVYALLLLRSRIRRRRWRAPKSVVERLPVRTYHTIASTTGSSSPHSTTPATPASPDASTPLLQSGARPVRQRPRSRTTGEVAASTSFGQSDTASTSLDHVQEKREAALAEWRRKYGGKQRECVVCLEEYVDGVSKVMSLPCGHEFHAECM